jgi:hypothetical protein
MQDRPSFAITPGTVGKCSHRTDSDLLDRLLSKSAGLNGAVIALAIQNSDLTANAILALNFKATLGPNSEEDCGLHIQKHK